MSGLVLLVASSILLGQKTNGILLSCRGLCSQLLQRILDELQKWICRTVCPSLAAYLEPLAHHQNLASLSHYLVDVHLNCLNCFHFLILEGGLLVILMMHCFSVTTPRYYKGVYVNSFFPLTARLGNSLRKECVYLTYDLSGFKSRTNRHFLTLGSF